MAMVTSVLHDEKGFNMGADDVDMRSLPHHCLTYTIRCQFTCHRKPIGQFVMVIHCVDTKLSAQLFSA